VNLVDTGAEAIDGADGDEQAPGNAASGQGKVRFAFPKRTQTLKAAITRLQRLAG